MDRTIGIVIRAMSACEYTTPMVVTLVINCGAVLSTITATLCIVTNDSMERSLKGILISFSTANVLGGSLLLYEILTIICRLNDHMLDNFIIVSMVLSLSHLFLLALHYFLLLTSNVKKKAKDFFGLIPTTWITSAALGNMNVATDHNVRRRIFIAVFSLAVLFLLRTYTILLTKHKRNEENIKSYQERFLSTSRRTRGGGCSGEWSLGSLATILFTYIVCSFPWLLNEILGLYVDTGEVAYSISLLVYSLNFYVPSLVFIYLRYSTQGWGTSVTGLEQSYRLKRLYHRR